MTCSLIRDYNILLQKELRRLQGATRFSHGHDSSLPKKSQSSQEFMGLSNNPGALVQTQNGRALILTSPAKKDHQFIEAAKRVLQVSVSPADP